MPRGRKPIYTLEENKKRAYERTKAWRLKNPEGKAKQNARWRNRNPEKPASYTAKWKNKPGNRDKCLKAMKDWHEKNKEKRREEKLKHRYGLTVSDYELLFLEQNSKCAICLSSFTARLHVDHCHKTNKVRGLLCNGCNRTLGFAQDDPSILRKAAEYLEKAGKVQ